MTSCAKWSNGVRSSFLFCRIFFDEPASTSSENALEISFNTRASDP